VRLKLGLGLGLGLGLKLGLVLGLGLGYRDFCDIATQLHLVNVNKDHVMFCRRSLLIEVRVIA
jgi:hypothetical protein